MSYPFRLSIMRHFRTQENDAREQDRHGDSTAVVLGKRDSQYLRVTKEGKVVVPSVRSWIESEYPSGFNLYWHSPHTQAIESAGLLHLNKARWIEVDDLKERDLGDMKHVSSATTKESRKQNPFSWQPTGGMSCAQLEVVVVQALQLLSEESVDTALWVTHGTFMSVLRKRIFRWTQDQYNKQYFERNPLDWFENGSIFELARQNPNGRGGVTERFSWYRHVFPWQEDIAEWKEIPKPEGRSSAELLGSIT